MRATSLCGIGGSLASMARGPSAFGGSSSSCLNLEPSLVWGGGGGGGLGRMADLATNGLQLPGRQRTLLSTNLIAHGYHGYFSETKKQSDRQCTGSPYVHIQIYLHITTVNFTEIIGFRKLQLCTFTCCISYISGTVKAICMNI